MEKISITTADSVSDIYVGESWQSSARLIPGAETVILTDSNVFDIYGSSFPGCPVLKIEPGEGSKNMLTIEKLASEMLEKGIGRDGFMLAVGGGVVCDVAGFLSSVYMRGIRCAYVSTTLLSQVDASTGGKTGVNIGNLKNVVGTFSQPEFVICDTSMLSTLPEDEYLSGMAELIKTGLIGDSSIIDTLEKKCDDVMARSRELLSELVAKAVRFKASVVTRDERESSLRRVLNFGHTFGHAIELSRSLKHGFAVAEGMKLAAFFSMKKGFLGNKDCTRITRLLEKYSLLSALPLPVSEMKELIAHDKKRTGSDINFVFIEKIGSGTVRKVPLQEAIEFYSDIQASK